jgi:hypothetical protein
MELVKFSVFIRVCHFAPIFLMPLGFTPQSFVAYHGSMEGEWGVE